MVNLVRDYKFRSRKMQKRIGDIAATSFLTLYCHALESVSDNPLLSDPKSVEITTELNKTFSLSENTLDRILAFRQAGPKARCPYCNPCKKIR